MAKITGAHMPKLFEFIALALLIVVPILLLVLLWQVLRTYLPKLPPDELKGRRKVTALIGLLAIVGLVGLVAVGFKLKPGPLSRAGTKALGPKRVSVKAPSRPAKPVGLVTKGAAKPTPKAPATKPAPPKVPAAKPPAVAVRPKAPTKPVKIGPHTTPAGGPPAAVAKKPVAPPPPRPAGAPPSTAAKPPAGSPPKMPSTDPKVTTKPGAGPRVASKPAPKPAVTRRGYGLQVGAFLSAKAAGRLAAKYKKQGLPAFVRPIRLRGKYYHLVILGAYKTAKLAMREGLNLRRQKKIGRFYIRRLK